MQVKLVLTCERFLPHIKCCLTNNYLYRYMQPKEQIHPLRTSCWKPVKDITSKEMIMEHLRERVIGDGKEKEMDKLNEKHADIQRKLKFLTECLKDLSEDNQKLISIMKRK